MWSSLLVKLIAVTLCVLAPPVENAKILGLFTLPAQSQHVLGSALMKALAKRGHNVTMISIYKMKNPPPNYHEILIENALERKDAFMDTFQNPNTTIFQKIGMVKELIHFVTNFALDDPNVQQFLKDNDKFDVTIQLTMFSEALLGISHKLNSSVIGYNSVGTTPWVNYHMGNPSPYSYVPLLFLPFTNEMSFLQRVLNVGLNVVFDLLLHYGNMPLQEAVMRKHFPDAPPLQDLMDNLNLYLMNSHFTTESMRPYMPNMIRIGGYHLEDIEEIPKDMKDFLDASTNGVVLFSLGSNIKVSYLPPGSVDAIINTFKKSKYNLLWKNELQIKNLPKNIMIADWLPQRAVLAHPNVKAFVTHAGLGGTVEAIYMGVPMICVPFAGDQFINTADSVNNGYAIQISKQDFKEESFKKAVTEITENKKYTEIVKKKSDLYRNQEMNPMDKAIFWIEHVIRHGGTSHLKSMSNKIPWYQYYLLDVISFYLALLFACLFITFIVTRKILRTICRMLGFCKQSQPTKSKPKVKKH